MLTKKKVHRHGRRMLGVRAVARRLVRLAKEPVFILFTVFGNGLIILGAVGLHWLEKDINPSITSFLDSLCWAVGVVSTVGASQVIPVSTAGKWLSILMMMGGALFLWSYMGLFVSALISPELNTLEEEIRDLESDLSQLGTLPNQGPRA